MQLLIEPILVSDELELLLGACDLLFSDVGASGNLRFFGCAQGGALVGAVGLEAYGELGLLRSLAVAPAVRGSGLGRALVSFVEEEARRAQIRSLYLLTNTASAFFARLGYHHAARDDAPSPIRTTTQFTSLCPPSSQLMRKRLKTPQPASALS